MQIIFHQLQDTNALLNKHGITPDWYERWFVEHIRAVLLTIHKNHTGIRHIKNLYSGKESVDEYIREHTTDLDEISHTILHTMITETFEIAIMQIRPAPTPKTPPMRR